MPDQTDDVLEIPVTDPVAGDGGNPVPDQEIEMPAVDLSENVSNIMLTRTLQVGAVVEANLAEINKLLTFDHLENKRMVSLQSSLGAREVQAKETPGGPANANKP